MNTKSFTIVIIPYNEWINTRNRVNISWKNLLDLTGWWVIELKIMLFLSDMLHKGRIFLYKQVHKLNTIFWKSHSKNNADTKVKAIGSAECGIKETLPSCSIKLKLYNTYIGIKSFYSKTIWSRLFWNFHL